MTQVEFDKEKIQKYENLQAEYKKLLEEYEDIKSEDPYSPKLEDIVKEMSIKQKEIQDLASKWSQK